MYNQSIKEEYLVSKSKSIQYILSNIFVKSEIYEETKEKDICNFTENEILEFLTGFASISLNTIASYTSLLRSYTQWCCDNNINGNYINHFNMITLKMMNNCINKIVENEKIISFEELHKVMKDIVNVCDKALIYSIFYGICGKDCVELTEIRSNDIDMNNQKIKLSTEREICIPIDLCYMLRYSCDTYDYILTSSGRLDSLSLDINDKSPFKRRSNARYSTQDKARLRIISRLIKLREDTGCIALTIDRLKNSGIIYHIKKAMKNNTELNKENIYKSREMQEILKQYNCEHIQSFTLKAKYKDYL